MNGVAIAKETIRIIKEKKYTVNGRIVVLPQIDYENVVVYSPMVAIAVCK